MPAEKKQTWDEVLASYKSKIPVEIILSSAAGFSIFTMSDELIGFARWVAKWTTYWGEFWAWALNIPLNYINIDIDQNQASALSAVLLTCIMLIKSWPMYEEKHLSKIKIGIIDWIFSLIFTLVVSYVLFAKVYMDAYFKFTGQEDMTMSIRELDTYALIWIPLMIVLIIHCIVAWKYLNRHYPDSLQIHGDRSQIAPPL